MLRVTVPPELTAVGVVAVSVGAIRFTVTLVEVLVICCPRLYVIT